MSQITTKGNKGEWTEIYVFLKLLADGKIYSANPQMERIPTSFLNIIKIIREEIRGKKFEYFTGQKIKIYLNGDLKNLPFSLDKSVFLKNATELFSIIQSSNAASFAAPKIQSFLNSIFVNKLKPTGSDLTSDIELEIQDYNSGIQSEAGFSIKSDYSQKATLFNASKNTNFVYEISNMSDSLMEAFNGTLVYRSSKPTIPIKARMDILKENNCSLSYIGTNSYKDPVHDFAKANLVKAGGLELPQIVGEMLKVFYLRGISSLSEIVKILAEEDPIGYFASDKDVYYGKKVEDLVYNMFTGMRMSTMWDGRSTVNGGYIIAKESGEILAFHTCFSDNFKKFLLNSLRLESASCSRHDYCSIFKENDRFYIKLNLQIRF